MIGPARLLVASGMLATLIGCSVTEPVTVIGLDGRVLRGSATGALSGGSFQVTDGTLTCSGSYDPLSMSVPITMPVMCSDGRKGFVIATRQENLTDGFGTVTLNDGQRANFVFGKAARAF